jgi:hypothetical protein
MIGEPPKRTAQAAVCVLLGAGAAIAEGERSLDAASPESTTALPGEESGRIDESDDESTWLLVGRGVLFVPRTIVDVAFAPVRGGLWLVDRYDLVDRYERLFFNDAKTIGLYPVASIESGFGFNAGARFVHRELFGAREHLSLRASTGGRFRQRLVTTFRSGERFGRHAAFELGGELERRPKDAFYGIGNAEDAVETRHRQQLSRASAAIDVRPVADLHVRVAGALSEIAYGSSEYGRSIETIHDTTMLPGWSGVRNAYGELELRWDSRRSSGAWEPPSIISAGWLGAVYGGRMHQLDGAADYWRYGVDLQHFHRLGIGPRVLLTRVHVEAVGAGDVAFTELPQLGGELLLRGYPSDRFRDRVAALGSVAYQWDLSRHSSATLFVDAGRVYGSIDDMTLEDLRVGYGIGLDVHTTSSFVAEASVATSRDGGVFLNVAFEPAFAVSPREERR